MKFTGRRIETDYGTLVIYRDRAGDLRWKVLAKNGRKIANGSEGYKTKRSLKRGLDIASMVLGCADPVTL